MLEVILHIVRQHDRVKQNQHFEQFTDAVFGRWIPRDPCMHRAGLM